jgi:hypothetical protein
MECEEKLSRLTEHYNNLIQILEAQQETECREFAHLAISHIWQFARGSGYPLKWEISDADFRSVLKHYGIKWGSEGQGGTRPE